MRISPSATRLVETSGGINHYEKSPSGNWGGEIVTKESFTSAPLAFVDQSGDYWVVADTSGGINAYVKAPGESWGGQVVATGSFTSAPVGFVDSGDNMNVFVDTSGGINHYVQSPGGRAVRDCSLPSPIPCSAQLRVPTDQPEKQRRHQHTATYLLWADRLLSFGGECERIHGEFEGRPVNRRQGETHSLGD